MSKPKGPSSLEEALRRLEEVCGYDSAREQESVAEAAREGGGVAQVSWWRESLARFEEAEGRRLAPPPKPLKS